MNESQLVGAIKAHIAKGDKAKDKAEQHYIAAGQYLKQLKDDCPDQQTFLEKVEKEIGIGKSRTYELLQIGDGRKTVAEVRADTATRVAKHEQSRSLANGQNNADLEASVEAIAAMCALAPDRLDKTQAEIAADAAAATPEDSQEAVYEQAFPLLKRMTCENLERLLRFLRFYTKYRREYGTPPEAAPLVMERVATGPGGAEFKFRAGAAASAVFDAAISHKKAPHEAGQI